MTDSASPATENVANPPAVTKSAKPYVCDTRWGIINPWGDVWTTETFETKQAAREYLVAFWRDHRKMFPSEIKHFTIEQVRVTVERKG